MNTEILENQSKEVVKFRRTETSLIGSPIVGIFATSVYFLDQNLLLSLAIGGFMAMLGNICNYSDGKIKYITVGGVASTVPFVGALIPKEVRISEDSPYTFAKDQVPSKNASKTKKAKTFFEENTETRDAWDNLFRSETGCNAYYYLEDTAITDLFGEGLHAWYIQSMEIILASRGRVCSEDSSSGNFIDKAERALYRRKMVKAKAKGEYIPIHWEYIVA